MQYWKVCCNEKRWPGIWLRCFQHQVAALGWPTQWHNHKREKRASLSAAVNATAAMQPGDKIIVQLIGSRVGRIGEIVRVEAAKWRPLITVSKVHPDGEMGRHILIRWDAINGPPSPDLVVELPPQARFTSGIRRATICRVPAPMYRRIEKAYRDRKFWAPYSPHVFAAEKSVSDYLATYPQRFEDGMQPHPSRKVREKLFPDKTRADVLLIDRHGNPVIIECKQGTLTKENVEQLRNYLRHGRKEFGSYPRGILVHGGASTLPSAVRRAIRKVPKIEVFRYTFEVGFQAGE